MMWHDWIIAISSAVSAVATAAVVFVYWRISNQTDKQLALTRNSLEKVDQQIALGRSQLDASKQLFLEANRPRVSVVLEKTQYVGMGQKGRLDCELLIQNFGAGTAINLKVQIVFKLLDLTHCVSIGPLILHPGAPYGKTLQVPIPTPERLLELSAAAGFAYQSIGGGGSYTQEERQNYDHPSQRFVVYSANETRNFAD